MALNGYGVLIGRVVGRKAETYEQAPHYQLHVRADSTDFRLGVNVRSTQSPPGLLYLVVENFHHPLLQTLTELPEGFHPRGERPDGLALDYIRGNLFDPTMMQLLPVASPLNDDLADKVEHFVARALTEPAARVYAFGHRWGPETGTPDKIFGFTQASGVHDIHMNQGISGYYLQDDAVWQDGALLLHYPDQSQWVAIFLAFQSQAWHTDDRSGHAITGEPGH
jgi:uncharacterized protein YukJ